MGMLSETKNQTTINKSGLSPIIQWVAGIVLVGFAAIISVFEIIGQARKRKNESIPIEHYQK
jgi:hypothetical protein